MSILPPTLSDRERRLIERNERLEDEIKTLTQAISEAVEQARREVWQKAIEIAQGFGTAAFKERQKRFTSKSNHDLIIAQDAADDIAKALMARKER